MGPAPEGSDERRQARMLLISEARTARASGASFDTFTERARQSLIDAVTEQDLDAIFYLVWKTKRPFV